MRNTILITVLLAFAWSCKKSEQGLSVSPTARYAKSGVRSTVAFRLYATAGEVKDPALVARFDALDSQYASGSMQSMATNPNGFLDTLTFPTENSARVLSTYLKSDYDLATGNGGFILTGKDTLTGYVSNVEMSRSFAYLIAQVRPQIHSEESYSVGFGGYTCMYR